MTNGKSNREPARRVFASELRAADYTFKEDDSEYAPKYILLPSGGKANRVFICGTLTEKTDKEKEGGQGWSAKVNDGHANYSIYAGQYQPVAANQLEDIEVPSFVAVVAKPDTFSPEDDDTTITTLRAEEVIPIDKETKHWWVTETAQKTIDRIKQDPDDNKYAKEAEERYGDRRELLKDDIISVLEKMV